MNYEDVMKLALERGFYFPSCEVYADAQAGFWEYGPCGVILQNNIKCPKCKGDFENAKKFNMMFKVGIGPEEEPAYLRPETCQSIFVDFPRLFKTMRGKLPLGIAQVGKSFRNEISPRQSLLRLREFYQAEIEIFCNP